MLIKMLDTDFLLMPDFQPIQFSSTTCLPFHLPIGLPHASRLDPNSPLIPNVFP